MSDSPRQNKRVKVKAKLSVCSLFIQEEAGPRCVRHEGWVQGSESRPSRVSWLRWGELGLGGLLGLELFEGVECLVESESG